MTGRLARGAETRRKREGRLLAAIVVLALAAASAPLARAHDDPDAQVAALTRRIAADPGSTALHLERAELHRFRRDGRSALADLHEAKRLDPGLPAIDLALAHLMLDEDNPDAANEAADRFLLAQPEHIGALLLRGRIRARLGDGSGAADDIGRAIALDLRHRTAGSAVPPDDYLLRARLLAAAGRADEAVRSLDAGMAALGSPVTLALLAVEIDVTRGRHDAALQRLAGLEARARRKETWQARRAQVLDAAGRVREADAARHAALASIAALGPAQRSTAATVALERDLRRDLRGGEPTSGEHHAR